MLSEYVLRQSGPRRHDARWAAHMALEFAVTPEARGAPRRPYFFAGAAGAAVAARGTWIGSPIILAH
jgi:hypothetical protein